MVPAAIRSRRETDIKKINIILLCSRRLLFHSLNYNLWLEKIHLLKTGPINLQSVPRKNVLFWNIVHLFPSFAPFASPFADVFNSVATKGKETTGMGVRVAWRCWAGSMVFVILQRMSPAPSSFQAPSLIGTTDASSAAVLSATWRQLGFVVPVLMAKNRLHQKGIIV